MLFGNKDLTVKFSRSKLKDFKEELAKMYLQIKNQRFSYKEEIK